MSDDQFSPSVENATRLDTFAVRWRCPPNRLEFTSTEEIEVGHRILGQEDAVDALRFGLENRIQGNNVFVRGLSGFGRMALIHQTIEDAETRTVTAPDRCYVHNFNAPDQPRLLELPTGRGKEFRDTMDEFAAFVQSDLPEYLNSDYVKSSQKQLAAQTQERIQEIGRPFEEDLRQAGLVMVPMQVGQSMVPVILPVIDGKPVQFDELQQQRLEGSVSEEEFKSLLEKVSSFEKKFADLGEEIEATRMAHQEALKNLIVEEATNVVESRLNAVKRRFNLPRVAAFLDEIKDDLIQHRLQNPHIASNFVRAYQVNLISHHAAHARTPVVSVTTPTLGNLIGKVVLVGDPDLYYMLDRYEPRFSSLFKVLADFSDSIARDDDGFQAYANVTARLVERDGLNHFAASGVAGLIEHGARICAQQGRLSTRFGRIADIAREASFVARKAGKVLVDGEDVRMNIERARRRGDLPARRFHRLLAERTLMIDVNGQATGQSNGLAVSSAGLLTYGFPTRITASIGPGTAGAINIERESELSGSVHTKGFLILNGLLRYLLRLQHPMAFSAAIAFEQSYGGVDGDSASGAEFCCLISALTDLPIRQDLAMTGAVDQKGKILPIGAATEKIEGFYDACKAVEFTANQGVIIPAANAGQLMLREDIVESVERGEFSIFAITRIDEAMMILMSRQSGKPEDGCYAEGSILALSQERAHNF